MSTDDVAQPAKLATARIASANEGSSRSMGREVLRGAVRRGVFELSEACIARCSNAARVSSIGAFASANGCNAVVALVSARCCGGLPMIRLSQPPIAASPGLRSANRNIGASSAASFASTPRRSAIHCGSG
ncbi:hypothetical protein ABH944_002953 [Caballeronia udeis]|uniref:Uncharacterized protein n=1 Tax=Caballeronia udeis TaxID=1232866 RepID=A0ABW8MHN1_9BURK